MDTKSHLPHGSKGTGRAFPASFLNSKGSIPITWLISSLVIIAVLTVVAVLVLNAPRILAASDHEPGRIDYICVYAGESPRNARAIELAGSHPGAVVLVNGGQEAVWRKLAREGKVDSARVRLLEKSEDTADEARAFARFFAGLRDSGGQKPSVVMVSSAFHLRRIRFLVRRERVGGKVGALAFVASPSRHYDLGHAGRRWWKDKNVRKVVISEYIKLAGHILTGR